VDETGAVVGYDDYDPWGKVLAGRSLATPWSAGQGAAMNKFTGKLFDDDYGLNWYYFGARYYDADVGRWWSVDSLVKQYSSLSPYNYSENNPTTKLDIDGKGIFDYRNLKFLKKNKGKMVKQEAYYILDNAVSFLGGTNDKFRIYLRGWNEYGPHVKGINDNTSDLNWFEPSGTFIKYYSQVSSTSFEHDLDISINGVSIKQTSIKVNNEASIRIKIKFVYVDKDGKQIGGKDAKDLYNNVPETNGNASLMIIFGGLSQIKEFLENRSYKLVHNNHGKFGILPIKKVIDH